MEKILAPFFALALLVSACAKQEEAAPPPQGLLSKDKMVAVLVDIHVAEAMINAEAQDVAAAKALYKQYESAIFDKHAVDSAAYFASYGYYLTGMDKMKEIYDVVVDTLSARKEAMAPSRKID